MAKFGKQYNSKIFKFLNRPTPDIQVNNANNDMPNSNNLDRINWMCPRCGIHFLFNRMEKSEHAKSCDNTYAKSIGLLLIATGKYDIFVNPLIESARKFLFPGQKLIFFLFTDADPVKFEADDIIVIPHEHKPWPYPTLYRYKTFYVNKDIFVDIDYLYYCDVDMQFVDIVGQEAIGDRVATLHPGYTGTRGTPEYRPQSTAYIPPNFNNMYFAGGFNGGRREVFLEMSRVINDNIDRDLSMGIIAIWHDESHMNKYFFDHKPTVILDPGYCYGESMVLPFKKRLLALNKNHADMRS